MLRPYDSMQTLDTLEAGDRAEILEIGGEADTVERLMEMGVVAGTQIQVLKFAPLGDPLEIEIRGYHLSLRRTEAAEISVRKI